jgi:hypothetical protein
MARPVYVVHCVDTEGPLHESVEATFERLEAIFGIDLEPSVALLRQLQAGEVDLGGIEQAVRKVVDPHLLGYNDTWDKIDDMLASCMSPAFREQTVDSRGHGWVYNWFCVDHVDYDVNPRRRDMGYHNVYDHYQGVLRETGSAQDGVQFHYHPHGFRRVANHSATHWWASSDSLIQVLSRRVIDRRWFPAAHRAGFHVIRPDSHWFLEQHIPFDLSSQAVAPVADDSAQSGLDDGRWGDWRRAPVTWEPYHPAHDDYQARGSCRRWIARCLNIGTRYRLLSEEHVRQAFAEAEADRPVVLAFTNHDFRDMRPDIDGVRELLVRVGREFPDVPFLFSEAVTAMREALQLAAHPACELDVTLVQTGPSTHVMEVRSQVPTFGPQPWLALRTLGGTYHHDNLDIDEPFHRWRYVFDEETFPLGALDAIGLAANNTYGVTTVVSVDPASGTVGRRILNDPAAAVSAGHGA